MRSSTDVTAGASMVDRAMLWSDPALDGTIFLSADYRAQRFTRHFHEEYAIGIIESGCQTFFYDGARRIDMTGGTVALISPGVVHSGGPGASEGWTYRMLYPPRHLVEAAVCDIFGPSSAVPSFNSPAVVDPRLHDAVKRLHRASRDGDANHRGGHDALELQSRMLFVLRHAFACHAACAAPNDGALARPALRTVRDMIADHHGCELILSELARHAGLGRFQLLRQFKAVFGLPPHAYGRQVRLARAHALILAGTTLAAAVRRGLRRPGAHDPGLPRQPRLYAGRAAPFEIAEQASGT